MAKLYTITGNLLAETTAYYDVVKSGKTHRATREDFQVGGKGINASRLVSLIGGESKAIYFAGGLVGERCRDWLERQAFATKGFELAGGTRSGWVVRAEGNAETTYLGKDVPVSLKAWSDALDWIEKQAEAGDGVALCGSVPGWNEELAKRWERFVRENGERFTLGVDSYGPPLKDAVGLPLEIVKINRKEFSLLVGEKVSAGTMRRHLQGLKRRYPVKNWVVTNGGGAVMGIDRDGNFFKVEPQKVEEVSPVGSGDVLWGGLLHEILNGKSPTDSLLTAMPWATANAASAGICTFDPKEWPPLPQSALTFGGRWRLPELPRGDGITT